MWCLQHPRDQPSSPSSSPLGGEEKNRQKKSTQRGLETHFPQIKPSTIAALVIIIYIHHHHHAGRYMQPFWEGLQSLEKCKTHHSEKDFKNAIDKTGRVSNPTKSSLLSSISVFYYIKLSLPSISLWVSFRATLTLKIKNDFLQRKMFCFVYFACL